jgi:hypothetical protein
MNYFKTWLDIHDLKQQYKKHCSRLHPDKGGNVEEFQTMQNEYLKALSQEQQKKTPQPKKKIIVRKVVKRARKQKSINEILREAETTVNNFKTFIDAIKKAVR